MDTLMLVPLASFVAATILGGIVWHHRPLLRVHKALGVMLLVSIFWGISSFMLHADFFPEQAVGWYGCLAFCVLGISVAYYRFSQIFIGKPIDWLFRRLKFSRQSVFTHLLIVIEVTVSK